jgi:hypothetical protein
VENKKTLSQDSQYAIWDSKWISPEYNTHSVSKETMMLQCLLTNFTPVFDTPARTEKQIKKSMVHSIKGLVISV